MKQKKKQILLLISLILILFIINYSFIDKALKEFLLDSETAVVERVIDGDTIVIDNKTSVRLLGINSPERGEPYYNEAKEFLEMIVLNKTVELKFGKDKYDMYHRILAYVFLRGENVNLELVDEGLANFYFPSGRDVYYDKFVRVWEKCIKMNENLCERSTDECAECIELKKFDYKNQIVVFYNKCDFNCELSGWKIKDEGRKNFIFPQFVLEKNKQVEIKAEEGTNTKSTLFWTGEEYVWTSSGDTLLLRDDDGKLVLWESY